MNGLVSPLAVALSRERTRQVCRIFALDLMNVAIVAMLLFQVVKTGLNLSGAWLLYPYVVAAGLAGLWVPAAILRARAGRLPSIVGPHVAVALTVGLLAVYHGVVLQEDGFDVLSSIRFYYGVFILTFGFVAFLTWLDAGASVVKANVVRLVETAIVLSFVIATVEFVGLITRLASPTQFWWIPPGGIDDLIRYQELGQYSAIRPQGVASNSSVLGAFSVFLALYYYSQVRGGLRVRQIVVMTCALATVLMARSGMAVLLLGLSLWPIARKHGAFRSARNGRLVMAAALLIATAAVGYELGEGGRLHANYFSRLKDLGGDTSRFAVAALSSNSVAPLFGAMNLYQFNKVDPVPFRWPGEVSYYDFSLLAFVIEFGFVGLGVYLYAWRRLVASAFPRGPSSARWAFWLLIVGSLHYGVALWVCTQVMASIVLASHCYSTFRDRVPGVSPLA